MPINTPIMGKEEITAAVSVLKSGILTSAANRGGKHVQLFEKQASLLTKSKYAVAVNSGTAALQAALLALDVKHGDHVLMPSFTFVATANAVLSTGAKPIFVDIKKDDYTIDTDDLKCKITKKTKAIIPVHLYGNVADVDRLAKVSKKHNIPVIEDAAQSLGSTYKKRHAGTFFEMGCFSMYPAKVMTSGEGGFIVTGSKKLHDRLLMIRNHGMIHGYDTQTFGLNLRLPEISAAIATVQLRKLGSFLQARKRNAEYLSSLISDLKITMPNPKKHMRTNWYLYTIATSKRNMLLKKLAEKGIGAASYYPIPVHKTPLYKSKDKLPVTDWAASHVLSIPIHPNVTAKDLQLAAGIMHKVL